MSTAPVLLALDFDGVLHPKQAGGPHFVPECCNLLAEILNSAPHVEIVLTTTWKEAYSLARLKTLLPPTIGSRVVAAAPSLDPNLDAVRQKEVLAFLAKAPRYTKWVALDDDATLFKPACPQLVLCDPSCGFSAKEVPALRARLSG